MNGSRSCVGIGVALEMADLMGHDLAEHREVFVIFFPVWEYRRIHINDACTESRWGGAEVVGASRRVEAGPHSHFFVRRDRDFIDALRAAGGDADRSAARYIAPILLSPAKCKGYRVSVDGGE